MLVKNGRLIMDDNDLAKVCAAAPEAVVIASHMDNVPHATLTRKTLAKKLEKKGIRNRVRIPRYGLKKSNVHLPGKMGCYLFIVTPFC